MAQVVSNLLEAGKEDWNDLSSSGGFYSSKKTIMPNTTIKRISRLKVIRTTGCPQCDADINESCRRVNGAARKANHRGRVDLATQALRVHKIALVDDRRNLLFPSSPRAS